MDSPRLILATKGRDSHAQLSRGIENKSIDLSRSGFKGGEGSELHPLENHKLLCILKNNGSGPHREAIGSHVPKCQRGLV